MARKTLELLGILLVSSFIVFGGLYLVPGSPETFLVQGRTVDAATLNAIREQFGLNDPFMVRYWHWLTGVLSGDFGQSLVNRQEVADLVWNRVPTTIWLIGFAAILIIVLGVGLGLLAGRYGGWLDRLVLGGATLGSAIPTFLAALLLMLVFSVGLGLFPVFGSGAGSPITRVWYLTLPALALAMPAAATVARVTRTSVFAERDSEHATFAVARGLPRHTIYRKHVARNALLPVVTVVGTNIAGLIAGSFVVEYAFALDGLGSLLIDSVQKKDFAVVQGVALILVLVFGVVNLIVDVLNSVIDPRIRMRGARA